MAIHSDCRHLYATMRLKGKSGTIWQNETWQIGHRLAVQPDLPMDPDSGRQSLPQFQVADAFVDRSDATWNIQQGFAGSLAGGSVVTDADQDAIAKGYFDFLTALKTNLYLGFALDSVRLYPVGADGKSRTAPSIYTPKVTTQNPTGVNGAPPDVAVAISYTTATRGVKGRGRVYLGGLSVAAIAGSGTLAARDTICQQAAALLTAWRDIGGLPTQMTYTPVLWHRKGDKLGVEDGTYGSPIRLVRVNDHFDTQRRRDRQVDPVWSTVAL